MASILLNKFLTSDTTLKAFTEYIESQTLQDILIYYLTIYILGALLKKAIGVHIEGGKFLIRNQDVAFAVLIVLVLGHINMRISALWPQFTQLELIVLNTSVLIAMAYPLSWFFKKGMPRMFFSRKFNKQAKGSLASKRKMYESEKESGAYLLKKFSLASDEIKQQTEEWSANQSVLRHFVKIFADGLMSVAICIYFCSNNWVIGGVVIAASILNILPTVNELRKIWRKPLVNLEKLVVTASGTFEDDD